MTTLRVLVADDELVARQRLKRLLGAVEGVAVVGECADGDEVLARVRAGGVDVVLLDVDMPKLSGAEVASLWPAGGPRIVFCTAHAQHAAHAFDVGAVDYVLKPVDPARLAVALERARGRPPGPRASAGELDRLAISTRQGVVLVPKGQVTHAVLEGELVTVHADGAQHLTDATLAELEASLAGVVTRVHRRALLNLAAVTRLEPLDTGGYLARLPSGEAVEVSRQAARALRRQLGLGRAERDDDGPDER